MTTRDECIEVSISRNEHGYGQSEVNVGGRVYKVYAHRMAYELAHGPVPSGLFVLHLCDNPPCINPAHLVAGTQQENVKQAVERSRMYNGQRGKTHCPQGHPYDDVNTYMDKKGKRSCKACARERNREGRKRKRST